MGRAPCCDKANVKRGPWSPDEDAALRSYVERHGTSGNWIALPQKAGLKRCGKSCRLRWLNYLRPNINHGNFTEEEDTIIFSLFRTIGSRWSVIASHLPGRTDNAVKNYWNSKLKKRVMAGENPQFNNSSSSSSVSFVKNSPLSSSVPSLIKNEVDFSVPFNSSYTFGTYDQLLPPVFPVMLANRSTSTANEDISAASLSVENWSSNKNNGDDDVLLSGLGIFELSFYSELLSGYDAEVTAPLSYSTLRV